MLSSSSSLLHLNDPTIVDGSLDEEKDVSATLETSTYSLGESLRSTSMGGGEDLSSTLPKNITREDTTATINSLHSSFTSTFHHSIRSSSKHNSFKPSNRHRNSLEELTINKLNFHSLGLYGRDAEVETLERAFHASKQQQQPQQQGNYSSTKKQLVMIQGYSGVGKTCLARTLIQRIQLETNHGIYAEGKFDQQVLMMSSQNKPYSAWVTICGIICSHILTRDDTTMHAIGTKIQDALGTELPILLRVFPALEEILVLPAPEEATHQAVNPNRVEAKASLGYVFTRFLHLVSQELSPMVLVLDDLQWADIASLELLETVMMDRELKLLVIGIYRSNEVDHSHALMSTMRDLQKHAEQSKNPLLEIRLIEIGNLEFQAIVKFLKDLLSTTEEDSKIYDLATVCEKKTQGNVFFLIHFLQHLHSKGLLEYNFGRMGWNWNAKEIEEKTAASENVVDLLLGKMKQLEEDEKAVLKLAACSGASFRRKYMALLWRQWLTDHQEASIVSADAEDGKSDDDQLDEALANLVFRGYLLMSEEHEDTFAFVHDKIQEAALSLTPQSGTESFCQWVGQTLLDGLESNDLGPLLFVVVNLLNKGTIPEDNSKRLELAELNSRAAKMAMELSAFDAASRYASFGIALTGQDAFSPEQYQLTIDLYSEGASAENCLGNTEKMEEYCKIVTARPGVAKEDTLRMKITWLDNLANRGMYRQASDETLSLLARFGVHFPKNGTIQSLSTLWKITKVSKGIKKGVLETIADLPKDSDPTRLKLLHLMDRLSVYLYYLHDDLMPLVMLRTYHWTLQYGLNDVTPAALTTLGIIFAGVLGELQAGSACAKAALALVPKVSPWMEGRTLFVAHGFGVIWTEPMHTQLKPLQRAYEAGLAAGDAESASWAIMIFYLVRFLLSFSLDLVIADVEMYMAQMKDLNQIVAWRSTLVNYQMFMNLAGRTDTDPLSLSGDYCKLEDHLRWLQEDGHYLGHCRLWECCIRTWYGEHEECAKLVLEYGSHTCLKMSPGAFSMSAFEVMSKGISCYVAARTSSSSSASIRRQYRKAALAIHKRVKKWIEQGCPNFGPLDQFLDAEKHAMDGKHFNAVKQYQAAIIIAARGGLLLEAGLFSEIFAIYLLRRGDDRNEVTYRLREAVKYYESFGAKRKIELLQRVYSDILLPQSPQDLHAIHILTSRRSKT